MGQPIFELGRHLGRSLEKCECAAKKNAAEQVTLEEENHRFLASIEASSSTSTESYDR
jgi:hypothetical protein